jgi:hypothetical protein
VYDFVEWGRGEGRGEQSILRIYKSPFSLLEKCGTIYQVPFRSFDNSCHLSLCQQSKKPWRHTQYSTQYTIYFSTSVKGQNLLYENINDEYILLYIFPLILINRKRRNIDMNT